MIVHLRRSIVSIVAFTVFFGFAYALLGTGVAQLLFRSEADGSLTANGSTLIGQNWSVLSTFDGVKAYWPATTWFNGRPDGTGPYSGDNPLVANGVDGESAATNLGPRSKVLLADTKELVAWWRAQGISPTPDLVTTSASGIDPDISPADALVQIPMIARTTGLSPSSLRALVASQTHGEQLGFIGASYVDVLELNTALARLAERSAHPTG